MAEVLRHTVGMAISEQGIDLADVGGWLGHSDLHTTRRTYAPIVNSRMRRISHSLDGRLSNWGAKAGAKNTNGDLTLVDISPGNPDGTLNAERSPEITKTR